ncbi:MAG: hypothetical protein OXJ55_16280 [Caldilineaceae bacterium]|nr:hypothetical protein [Caldilineaceae bacterium]
MTYNDGGARGGLIGYRGVCSDRIMVQNVEVDGRSWCSDPENECFKYCDRGRKGRRPTVPPVGGEVYDGVCYESQLLARKPLKFWAGTYQSGRKTGEPIPIDFGRVEKGDIVLLTTLAPQRTERDRIVFACYRVGGWGKDKWGNYIESDGTMDLVLPEGIAMYCRYWDYQTPNKDGSVFWGRGLFRYLDRDNTKRFVDELVFRLGDTSERDMLVRELGNSIEIRPPQGGLGRPRGTSEGEEHRRLKELVAAKPELIGLPAGSEPEIEHSFLSGDRVDVKFNLPNGDAAVVEVETIVPEPGAHQAVKYRALLEVQRSDALGSGHVQAILVAHEFDGETRKLAEKYQIRLVKLRA